MGILVFMYLICSLRTNVVFFAIFLFLDVALFLLTAAYWKAAAGDLATFKTLEIVSNAAFRSRTYQLPLTPNTVLIFASRAIGQWSLRICILRLWLVLAVRAAAQSGRLPVRSTRW